VNFRYDQAKENMMNIIEAVKSGKRFKRSGISSWVEPEEAQDLFRNLDYSALIADDWEVEEVNVLTA